MQEQKTLNEWMQALGYQWVDGREETVRGFMGRADAAAYIENLRREGKVQHG